MTIKELIQQLQKFPDTTLVVMSGDSEGNYFSPLSDIEELKYAAETTWSGEVRNVNEVEPEDDRFVDCIVLWPTN